MSDLQVGLQPGQQPGVTLTTIGQPQAFGGPPPGQPHQPSGLLSQPPGGILQPAPGTIVTSQPGTLTLIQQTAPPQQQVRVPICYCGRSSQN